MADKIRLIDANALRLMKVAECAEHTIEFAAGWKACVEYCKNDAPTIEAQPVRYGKWVRSSTQKHVEVTYECSECQHEVVGEYEKTPFCGGCGARMDGDSDDEP